MTSPDSDNISSHKEYSFQFDGSGTTYLLIFLKHIFLTLVTFGVYFAWAKSERRAFIWQSLSFHSSPFRYTGTGIELFKGYLLVAFGYFGFVGIPTLVRVWSVTLGQLLQGALVIGLFAVIPFVIYRSRAFLYSRTTWRGIRFGLKREYKAYAREFYVGALLTILTLGLYAPITQNRLHRILMNNTRFGSLEFRYDGDDKTIWWMTIKGVLLSIVTLGVYFSWFRASLERYRAEHTYIGESAALRSTVSGGQLYVLYMLNTVGLVLTLGLGFPWILMYSLRSLAGRYSVQGFVDFDGVVQRSTEEGAVAEGVADALDLDFGF